MTPLTCSLTICSAHMHEANERTNACQTTGGSNLRHVVLCQTIIIDIG